MHRLSKPDALKKLKAVKGILQMAEQHWPSPDTVPNFYAYYHVTNGFYWLCITNYWVWYDAEFTQFIKDVKTAVEEDGFTITECFVHPVAMAEHKRLCALRKDMFVTTQLTHAAQ